MKIKLVMMTHFLTIKPCFRTFESLIILSFDKMHDKDGYPVVIKCQDEFVALVPVPVLIKESVIFKSLVDQQHHHRSKL